MCREGTIGYRNREPCILILRNLPSTRATAASCSWQMHPSKVAVFVFHFLYHFLTVPQGRNSVKCVKRIKGKKGGPDRYELIVTIDLVIQSTFNRSLLSSTSSVASSLEFRDKMYKICAYRHHIPSNSFLIKP
jgi:hypothetical protein